MSSNPNNGGNAKAAGYAAAAAKGAAEQEKQSEQNAQQKAQSLAGTPQGQSSLGGNSVKFDKAGNTVVNGTITQFAGQSAKEDYLSARGVGNTGQVVNPTLFAAADFSAIGGTNAESTETVSKNKNGGNDYSLTFKEKVESGDNADFFGTSIAARPAKNQSEYADYIFNNQQKAPPALSPSGDYSWATLGSKSQSIGDKIFSNQKSFVAGSSDESNAIVSEQSRASAKVKNNENSDYFTGGSQPPAETLLVSTGKAKSVFGKTKSGEFGWKDLSSSQFTSGSDKENQAIATEQQKASALFPSTAKSDYQTGGTPDVFGGAGPATKKSVELGSSLGWTSRGNQFTSGSAQEQSVLLSEQNKASKKVQNNENPDYFTGGTILTDSGIGVQTKKSTELGSSLGWVANGKQLISGSKSEQNALAIEAAKGSKLYSNNENPDYFTDGTPDLLSATGPQTKQSQGKEFSWLSIAPKSLVRGSDQENTVIASELVKASGKYPNYENPDYVTGGTLPAGSSRTTLGILPKGFAAGAGPETPQSAGKSFGVLTMAPNSLIRGSDQENNALISEAFRASAKAPNNENPDYITGGTLPPNSSRPATGILPAGFALFPGPVVPSSKGSTSPSTPSAGGQSFKVKGGLSDQNAVPNKQVKSNSDESINKYNDVITGYNKNVGIANKQITEKNQQTELANQINYSNYIATSLGNAFDLYGNVSAIEKSGASGISVFNKSGAKIGEVQAKAKNAGVLSNIFDQTAEGTYYKPSVNQTAESKQLKSYKQSKNDLLSDTIVPSQQLGLNLNINDTKTGKTSKVPSESGYYSVIKSESQGKNVTVATAPPSNLSEIETYLGRQGSLINKGKDTGNPDYYRGQVSTILTDINTFVSAPLLSLPGRYNDLITGKASNTSITNPIGLLSGLVTPSVQKNFVSKQPETALNDVLNLQVPKESPSYLAGSASIDIYLIGESLLGAGSLATRAGSLARRGVLNKVNPYLARSAFEGEAQVRLEKPFLVNQRPQTYVDAFNRPIEPQTYIAPKGNPMENSITALTQPKNIRTIGTGQTLGTTNPTRNKLPSNILSNDNLEGKTPVSVRQNTVNPLLENVSNERVTQSQKIMSELLIPSTSTSKQSSVVTSKAPPEVLLSTSFSKPLYGTQVTKTKKVVNINGQTVNAPITENVIILPLSTSASPTGYSAVPSVEELYGTSGQVLPQWTGNVGYRNYINYGGQNPLGVDYESELSGRPYEINKRTGTLTRLYPAGNKEIVGLNQKSSEGKNLLQGTATDIQTLPFGLGEQYEVGNFIEGFGAKYPKNGEIEAKETSQEASVRLNQPTTFLESLYKRDTLRKQRYEKRVENEPLFWSNEWFKENKPEVRTKQKQHNENRMLSDTGLYGVKSINKKGQTFYKVVTPLEGFFGKSKFSYPENTSTHLGLVGESVPKMAATTNGFRYYQNYGGKNAIGFNFKTQNPTEIIGNNKRTGTKITKDYTEIKLSDTTPSKRPYITGSASDIQVSPTSLFSENILGFTEGKGGYSGSFNNKFVNPKQYYNEDVRQSRPQSRFIANGMELSRIGSDNGKISPQIKDILEGSGEARKEETTDFGLESLFNSQKNRILKLEKNEAIHGTDLVSGLDIVSNGPKFSKGLGLFKTDFFVSNDTNLAGRFATMRSLEGERSGVFVKTKLDESAIKWMNDVGPNTPIARADLQSARNEGFSGMERYDYGFGDFFANKKEIVIFNKKALVGKPTLIDASDLIGLQNIRSTARGVSPTSSFFPTSSSDVGGTRLGEIVETREKVPVTTYKNEIIDIFVKADKTYKPSKNYTRYFAKAGITEAESNNEISIGDVTGKLEGIQPNENPNKYRSKTKQVLDKDLNIIEVPSMIKRDIRGYHPKNEQNHYDFGVDVKSFAEPRSTLPKQSKYKTGIFHDFSGTFYSTNVNLEKGIGRLYSKGEGGKWNISTEKPSSPSSGDLLINAKTKKPSNKPEIKAESKPSSEGGIANIGSGKSVTELVSKTKTKKSSGQLLYGLEGEPNRNGLTTIHGGGNIHKPDFEILGNYDYFPSNKGPSSVSSTSFSEKPNKTLESSRSFFIAIPGHKTREASSQILDFERTPKQGTKQYYGLVQTPKRGTSSKYADILSGLNVSRTNEISGQLFKPTQRQSPKQGGKQATKQTAKYIEKPLLGFIQTPKQGTKPKQASKLIIPTPQQPRQPPKQSPKFKPAEMPRTPLILEPPPKKKPIGFLVGGYPPFKGGKRTKSGPTGIELLPVKNIFSSSLNIDVPRGRRYEF